MSPAIASLLARILARTAEQIRNLVSAAKRSARDSAAHDALLRMARSHALRYRRLRRTASGLAPVL